MTKIISIKKMKVNTCSVCGRKTYRMQHGIYLCSFCEQKWKVEFNGRRELIDRTTGTVVQVIDPSKKKDDAVNLPAQKEADNEDAQ